MTIHPNRLAALLLMAGFAIAYYRFYIPYSSDLMALWLAGKFLSMGRLDQIYPALTDLFIMHPPSEWRPFMTENYDYQGAIYPFLYPPLWAKLAALVSSVNFWRVAAIALAVNAALLMATIWLAFRASRSALHPALFVGIVLIILNFNQIGLIALNENQPQILVSFLLVLAIERSRAGAPITAGLALAIAASIKLYPAIFAVFWLFGREYRAFAGFVLFGIGLALISVLWAGWPLHADFLDQTRLISRTVLVTGASLTIDTTIAQLFFRDALLWFASAEVNERVSDPGWYALAKPPVWRGLSALTLLLVIVGLCRAFAHSSENTKASILWPMAITVVALLSPLSWPYYYIPTLCFAPVLLEKLGGRLGGAILFAGFFPMISLFLPYYWRMDDWPGWPPHVYQIVSVLCLCILSAGFLLAYLRAGEPSVRRTTA